MGTPMELSVSDCDTSARTFKKGGIPQPSFKDVIPQVIASCIVHCIVIQAGINMAYSTILTNGLKRGENNITIDENAESWIASIVTISLPIGSLLVGPLMDKFGRKTICLASCVPVIGSWILLMISNSLPMVYFARTMAGAAAGLTTVGLVYVSEITHPQVRPMLLCLNSVFVSFGILISCFFAMWLNWYQMAIIFLVLNIFIFFALFTIPESPYWLLCFNGEAFNEKRTAKAERSLKWLNRNHTFYEQEYERIKEIYHSRQQQEEVSKNILQSIKYYYHRVISPNVYKPIAILFFLLLLQQFSGVYVVIFYAISVFHEIGGSFGGGVDEYGALLLLGVIRFAMSLVTVYFSKIYGRRLLSIISGLGMTFSMFFSAMYLYLTSSCDENGQIVNQRWLLLVIVLFYVCMSSLGFIVIPWTMIGELLPISVRGTGSGVMTAVAYIIMFAVVKSFPYMLKAIGGQGVFFFFSLMSLAATSFVYIFLPETLGKTFAEIESYFDKGKEKSRQQIRTVDC
ncbi:facilitated trehalose transporter Tret1-2 homolog isoform X2 [Orussus abietinus]|uniref:facilitated trehalose transporter Tret1-2 homolog isoform X2 n=1 Tax=Orussus abietinus TaxID=222816 RepID=UPI000626B2C2|nr:facilitated trehalose transporter Tret1-2 homolog isoform X2 [Orussus abietinus]